MSEAIKSRPMFHSTACERCVFGRGAHAEWCGEHIREWVVWMVWIFQQRLEDSLYEMAYGPNEWILRNDAQKKAKG